MSWVNSLVDAGIEVLSKQFTLTSNWGSLNSQLIASIAPCDKSGKITGATVSAPLIDSTLSQQFGWSSPFENFTADSKSPTLAAMLQTGMIPNLIQAIDAKQTDSNDANSGMLSALAKFLKQGEGRTGITKLNSTQVFTGHEPLKIDGTLVFRAYADPVSEVTQPLLTLWKMAYPKSLADGTVILNNVQDVFNDAGGLLSGDTSKMDSLVKLVFPSESPSYVALQYRGVTYAPLVIESISRPLANPTCALGDVFATVQINLGTQRSWDVKDIENSQISAVDRLVKDTVSAVSNLF
jgi:hypothetical protein